MHNNVFFEQIITSRLGELGIQFLSLHGLVCNTVHVRIEDEIHELQQREEFSIL